MLIAFVFISLSPIICLAFGVDLLAVLDKTSNYFLTALAKNRDELSRRLVGHNILATVIMLSALLLPYLLLGVIGE